MDELIFHERPVLRKPILIVAFEGWNDAAEAATSAVEFLQTTWDAQTFAEIDPEEFYDFTEVRPTVRLTRNQRRIDWPANEFHFFRDPSRDHDFILFKGIEPSLRWKRFTSLIVQVVKEFDVTAVVTLGALLSDVPYNKQARVTVSATDEKLRAKLGRAAARPSRYEGPTGILSVLLEACSKAGVQGASMWGHAPHYLSASPNPVVTLGILKRLAGLLDLTLDYGELEGEAETFIGQVNEAVSRDPEASYYINQLSMQGEDEEEDEGESSRRPRGGGTSAGQNLIQDVEDFLRRRRSDEE